MTHVYMPHNEALRYAIQRAATYLAQGSDMRRVAQIVEAGLQQYVRRGAEHKRLRLVVNNQRTDARID